MQTSISIYHNGKQKKKKHFLHKPLFTLLEIEGIKKYLTPPSLCPGLFVLQILHLVRFAQLILPHLRKKSMTKAIHYTNFILKNTQKCTQVTSKLKVGYKYLKQVLSKI